MASLHLVIATPERKIIDDDVDQINATTTEGQIGILSGHINLMTKIMPGELEIKKGSQLIHLAIGSGLLQVADNRVSVMTDLAERAEDINEKVVEEAKERAIKALEQKLTDEEYAVALSTLEKSLAQLKVKRRHSRPL